MQPAANYPLINRILHAYGLAAVATAAPESGYRNQSHAADLADGRRANVIVYKSEPGILAKIRDAGRIGDFLAASGLPARAPLDQRVLRLRGQPRPKYAAVYTYLPGHTIAWEAYSMNHIKLMGQAMGLMHDRLGLPGAPSPQTEAAAVYTNIIKRMKVYFSRPEVTAALAGKLGLRLAPQPLRRAQRLMDYAANLPGQRPLHLDFVRSNLLFGRAGDTSLSVGSIGLTGIIDFEKTAVGHPVFDLGRSLAFLLVDVTTKSEAEITKYFLHSGYRKRGGQPLPDARLLQAFVDLFLLYDWYKFLRHNPYESLSQNHHYLRTCELLLERRIITSGTVGSIQTDRLNFIQR